MSSPNWIVFALGALLLFVAGPYWATYLLYRKIIAKLARDFSDKPATVFVLSVVLSYVWLAGTFFVLAVLVTVGLESRNNSFTWILILLSIPVGLIGWIFSAVKHFQRRALYSIYTRLNPVPNYQIWLQDILVGTFSLGLSMSMILNLRDKIQDPAATATLVIYEIVTQFAMFFAIMDACRFSERLKVPRDRALFIFMIMFANAFVPLPVLTALAWNVWRRALFLAKLELNPMRRQGAFSPSATQEPPPLS